MGVSEIKNNELDKVLFRERAQQMLRRVMQLWLYQL